MNKEEKTDKRKKKLIALVVVILILSIVIPFTFISFFLKEEGDSRYYFTYKEFQDQHNSLDLKDGDLVYIKDVFSDIWYNQTAHYTYMTFESMDSYRTDPWGYDAGYPNDITDEYQAGEKVILEIEMNQEMNEQGYPTLIGHIISIEHVR